MRSGWASAQAATESDLSARAFQSMHDWLARDARSENLQGGGRMRKYLLVLCAVVFFLSLKAAEACKPAGGFHSDHQLFASANFVGLARISSIEMKAVPAQECDAVICEYAQVDYVVLERFKGKPARSGSFVASQCVMCGFCFELGQIYLLFIDASGSADPMTGSALLDEDGWEENDGRIQSLREFAAEQTSE